MDREDTGDRPKTRKTLQEENARTDDDTDESYPSPQRNKKGTKTDMPFTANKKLDIVEGGNTVQANRPF
jgi:hypothetical protein